MQLETGITFGWMFLITARCCLLVRPRLERKAILDLAMNPQKANHSACRVSYLVTLRSHAKSRFPPHRTVSSAGCTTLAESDQMTMSGVS